MTKNEMTITHCFINGREFEVAGDGYEPKGAISQAWSVAEILRCWVEDIENITPKYEDVFLHKIRV